MNDLKDILVRMQRLFALYNTRFFSGRLPKYRIVVKPLRYNWDGRCDRKNRTLYLNPRKAGLDHIILHEMVHVKAGYCHGFIFHREVERLMRLSAPISPYLLFKPKWLIELPLCNKWANANGLSGSRPSISLPLEFEQAAKDGITTFRKASALISKDLGISVTAMWQRYSKKKAMRSFYESGSLGPIETKY